jgi:plasmid stability protein
MGQVLIRKLDDALLSDYRLAADRNGRSLEAELREALAQARPKVRLSADELRALSARLRSGTSASAAALDSVDLIREDRDTR